MLCAWMEPEPGADRRDPRSVRQAVTPVNLAGSGRLSGIAFPPRPPHPHEAERHTSKAPKGAFLLRNEWCEPADPSECSKD